jgi:hypothetical protein
MISGSSSKYERKINHTLTWKKRILSILSTNDNRLLPKKLSRNLASAALASEGRLGHYPFSFAANEVLPTQLSIE